MICFNSGVQGADWSRQHVLGEGQQVVWAVGKTMCTFRERLVLHSLLGGVPEMLASLLVSCRLIHEGTFRSFHCCTGDSWNGETAVL